mgnify:CR=1 FL=1
MQRSTTEIENEARWLFTYDAKILKEVCSIFYADLYDDISKDIFCAVSETDELDDITTSMVIAARESVERKGKRLEPRHYSLQEIVELQKETFKTIYHAIDEHESPEEEIKRYRKPYKKDTGDYERKSKEKELLEEMLKSDIVLIGDHHTLREAKTKMMRYLKRLIGKKDIVLALEMVPSKYQKHLDSYLSGEINEDEFLCRIKYDETWNFVFEDYKPLIEFAKERGIPVIAINSMPRRKKGRLLERDKRMAEAIANLDDGKLAYVVVGDWHLASNHLPRELKKRLRGKRILRVFQNSEDIYWNYTIKTKRRPGIVKISEDSYCVFSANPLLKLDSYLSFREEEDCFFDDDIPEDVKCHIFPKRRKNYRKQLKTFMRIVSKLAGLNGEHSRLLHV